MSLLDILFILLGLGLGYFITSHFFGTGQLA